MAIVVNGDFLTPPAGQVMDWSLGAPLPPLASTPGPMSSGNLVTYLIIGGVLAGILALIPDSGRRR